MSGYMNAMRRYFEFAGRSSRSEFWFFVLFYVILYVVVSLIEGYVLGTMGILTGIVALVHLIPSISVSVRRLHDIDRTGWWVLFFFGAPLLIMIIGAVMMGGSFLAMATGGDAGALAGAAGLGASALIMILLSLAIWIVALVFYCTRGTQGPNQYGPPTV